MKTLSTIAIASLLLAWGCSSKPPIPVSSQTSQTESEQRRPDDSQDAVRSKFEERIKADLVKITPRVQQSVDIGNGLSAQPVLDGDPIFDIKKTDSIVTPYEGVVFFPLKWMVKGRANSGDYSVRVDYVYRDSEWQRVESNLALNEKPIFVAGYYWGEELFK